MKLNYTYKWANTDWFSEPMGSDEIKQKLDDLAKYLNWERKKSMSIYEVRLYEWILKKQYKADPIRLYDWKEDITNGWSHRYIDNVRYYLGYYNPTRKSFMYQEDEYAKEQQKYRSKFYSKMGR